MPPWAVMIDGAVGRTVTEISRGLGQGMGEEVIEGVSEAASEAVGKAVSVASGHWRGRQWGG